MWPDFVDVWAYYVAPRLQNHILAVGLKVEIISSTRQNPINFWLHAELSSCCWLTLCLTLYSLKNLFREIAPSRPHAGTDGGNSQGSLHPQSFVLHPHIGEGTNLITSEMIWTLFAHHVQLGHSHYCVIICIIPMLKSNNNWKICGILFFIHFWLIDLGNYWFIYCKIFAKKWNVSIFWSLDTWKSGQFWLNRNGGQVWDTTPKAAPASSVI